MKNKQIRRPPFKLNLFKLQLFNDAVTKEALLEFLRKQPDGAKYAATVEAMEVAYRTEIERKTTDNKTVRTKLTETEKSLKTAQEKYSKIMTHLGIDEDVEDLDAELETISKAKGADAALQRKYDALDKKYKKEMGEKDTAIAEERSRRHDLLKTNSVIAGLTGKVHNPQEIAKLLLGNLKVSEDDSLTFTAADGKESSVDDGIKGWLTGNAWAAVNSQNPGGGSNGGGAGDKETSGSLGKELAKSVTQPDAKGAEIYFGGAR
ncbi:hypothetical protein [Sporomusa rhizae]|uniref:hypothetical protein n=1 Tax=Sporomusa rhizae TaxID=357999 RepID=UPI00352AFB99